MPTTRGRRTVPPAVRRYSAAMAPQLSPRSVETDIERELVALLRRIRSFHTAIAADVHPGLEPATYALMGVLHDAGPQRGADLVARLGLDKSTISRQVAQLVSLGMAERQEDAADGRVRVVRLTERGSAQLQELRGERQRRLARQFAHWSDEDLGELARWLGRLNEALARPLPADPEASG